MSAPTPHSGTSAIRRHPEAVSYTHLKLGIYTSTGLLGQSSEGAIPLLSSPGEAANGP